MEFFRKITIPKELNEKINFYLTHEPIDENDEYLHEDETIRYSAIFPNGMEMDIKCCGVQFEPGGVNTAWTEAVLFKNRYEIACSEVCDSYTGRWELKDKDGNIYITDVEVEA